MRRRQPIALPLLAISLGIAWSLLSVGAHAATSSIPSKTPSAIEFDIAPGGNNRNPGTAESPFATLAHARDAARQWRRKSGASASVHIILHGGEYLLTEPLHLDPADSGAPGNPLVIEAAPHEKPVLTSGVSITGWRKASADTPGLATEAAGHVWVADIPKGWRFHFLYADGYPEPVASSGKETDWHGWPKPVQAGPLGPEGQKLTFSPGLLDSLPGNGDLEINLMPVQYWNTISVLKGIDLGANTAFRHSKNPAAGAQGLFEFGNYSLQNALKFLTRPGEWCVDSEAGKVYFWPEWGDPTMMKIVAPKEYRLIELIGDSEKPEPVHDVEIRGLTFTITDRLPEDQWPDNWIKRNAELPDATLMMDGVAHCTVENCTFRYSGAYAIALLNYAQKNSIVRNEMDHPGCGGVLLQGFGPGTTDVNRDNLVARNYIHDTGAAGYLHSAAITLYQSGSNEIAYNWLEHLPYTGICVVGAAYSEYGTGGPLGACDTYGNSEAMYGTRWQEIPGGRQRKFTRADFKQYLHGRDNYIHDNVITNYMSVMSDGGALYSWSCGAGNKWEDNLLRRDVHHPNEQWVYPLYMDDYVDGATVKANICWHNTASLTLNKGANTWSGDIISAAKPEQFDLRMLQILKEGGVQGGWLRLPVDTGTPEIVISGRDRFFDKSEVSIAALRAGPVRYTTDGSAPTADSPVYGSPFSIDHTTTVSAAVFPGNVGSPVSAQRVFRKLEAKPLAANQWVTAGDAIELDGPRLDGKGHIGWCEGGGAIAFGPFEINAPDARVMEINAGVDPHFAGGQAHIHLDSTEGPEIGSITFQSTGTFDNFKPQDIPLKSGLAGRHLLWFVFQGGPGICNLESFRLVNAADAPADESQAGH